MKNISVLHLFANPHLFKLEKLLSLPSLSSYILAGELASVSYLQIVVMGTVIIREQIKPT